MNLASERGTFRKIALILALIVSVCYLSSLGGGFHFDDSHSIEGNLSIQSLSNIPNLWTDPTTSSFIPENRNYRPLNHTFYSICWFIGGGKTWPFHVMKMFFHFMVALAVFCIWKRLWSIPGWFTIQNLQLKFPFTKKVIEINPGSAAFLLAVIFCIHPACSECVDYISATSSLQCALFYVWAYYSYLRFRDTGKVIQLVSALILYFFSVASKEEGITLPATIFLTEMFLQSGSFWKKTEIGIRKSLPFVATGIVLASWIYFMHPPEGNESRGYATSFQYFITQWRAYLWYMKIWFWPWDLNADNASIAFSKSLLDPLVIQSAIGNLLILLFAWSLRKKYPAVLFGLAWFYITISPASSVVVLAEAINEHRMYLAYIGFIGGVFVLLLKGAESFFSSETRASRLGWIFGVICFGLVIGTQERNRVWATDENLWLDTVEKNPTSGRALNNLSLVYLGRGEYAKAVDYLKRCEVHWSSYMYCPLNLGIAYFALGTIDYAQGKSIESQDHYQLAQESFERAYRLNPRSVHVNFHLGRLYDEIKKDYPKAIELYSKAISLTGGRYPLAEIRIASCYRKQKKYSEAIQALERALNIEPNNEFGIFEKANIEFESGNISAATQTIQRFVSLNPNHPMALMTYGLIEMQQAHYHSAIQLFERAANLDPKNKDAWKNLLLAANKVGSLDLIQKATQQLRQMDPTYEKTN